MKNIKKMAGRVLWSFICALKSWRKRGVVGLLIITCTARLFSIYMPRDKENYKIRRRVADMTTMQIQEGSLEGLVNSFNRDPSQDTFDKILDIVKKICSAVQYQYTSDRKGLSALQQKEASELFNGYTGKMIPIRSGWGAYYIPDYKVLKNINETEEKSLKNNVKDDFFSSVWIILPGSFDRGILAQLKKDRLVDFLDAMVQKAENDYRLIQAEQSKKWFWQRRWW